MMVKAAAPLAAPAANALDKVTVQVNVAPAAEGNVPQLTLDTPVPAVTAVAITPAGKASLTVTLVPEAVPPLFPSPRVYVIDAPVEAEAGPVLLNVTLTGVFTVVAALPQLVVAHDPPGVAGLAPPVGSTDA